MLRFAWGSFQFLIVGLAVLIIWLNRGVFETTDKATLRAFDLVEERVYSTDPSAKEEALVIYRREVIDNTRGKAPWQAVTSYLEGNKNKGHLWGNSIRIWRMQVGEAGERVSVAQNPDGTIEIIDYDSARWDEATEAGTRPYQ